MKKTDELCSQVDNLQHDAITGQAAAQIVRSCINQSLLHLARTVEPEIMHPAAVRLFEHVRDGISLKLALPTWNFLPEFARLVFPLAASLGGAGITDMSAGLECAYVASMAETLKQQVFFGSVRPPPDPDELFSVPESVPMWPIVLSMHAQGSPAPKPVDRPGADMVSALGRALDTLAAKGAADYFDQHLNAACPTLPRTVDHFVNYFGSAGVQITRLQQHLTSFINKKQHDAVFQFTVGREDMRARLLTNAAPGASLMLTTVPREPRFEQKTEETRVAFTLRLGLPYVMVDPRIKTLLCAHCHTSLLHDPDHHVICAIGHPCDSFGVCGRPRRRRLSR